MFRLFKLILIFCVPVVIVACARKPSEGARGMPGAMGALEFKPDDWGVTWWMDTDGVDPGTAGCHVGTVSKDSKTPNGRMFGEACQKHGLLVEPNPEKGRVHAHTNDIGNPDSFDCNAWCIGQGPSKGGTCEEVTGADAPPPREKSAMCVCLKGF